MANAVIQSFLPFIVGGGSNHFLGEILYQCGSTVFTKIYDLALSIFNSLSNIHKITPKSSKEKIIEQEEEIEGYLNDNLRDINTLEDRRKGIGLKNIIVVNKNPTKLDLEKINEDTLRLFSRKVNSSLFHYTGNCVPLSRCFLYNANNGKTSLSCRNSTLSTSGISCYLTEQLIFGKNLTKVSQSNTIDEVETEIIKQFNMHGTRFFVIDLDRNKNKIGHAFNAAVLFDNQGTPYIKFIDAWRTSNPIPSKKDISSRYADGHFTLRIESE